ncbi:MAG: TRIC cation channel family protein [Desulfovibrio sp.]|nr:TRIC cation channel family protein [Desulfovibrio sp.]
MVSRFVFYDALCVFLLSGAAACRARFCGAHFTGAAVLGIVCGLFGPLFREAIIHGGAAVVFSQDSLLAAALVGALTGAFTGRRLWADRLDLLLDSSGLAVCACLAALCALPVMGLGGAVLFGAMTGLLPGLVRDVALGDTARMVEESWYATAVVLGIVTCLAVMLLVPEGIGCIQADIMAMSVGCAMSICVRWVSGKKA